MRTLCLALVVAVGGSSAASDARAASITWQFQAVVRLISISPTFPATTAPLLEARLGSLGVELGAPLNGSITFESSTPDLRPEPDNAEFADAVTAFQLVFPGGSLSEAPDLNPTDPRDPSRTIFVGTDPVIGSWEYPDVDLLDPLGVLRLPLCSLELSSVNPAFFDPRGLPLDPPDLSLLDPFGADPNSLFGFGTEFFFAAMGPDGNFTLHAELTSLVRAPEPGAGALLAVLATLLGYARLRA